MISWQYYLIPLSFLFLMGLMRSLILIQDRMLLAKLLMVLKDFSLTQVMLQVVITSRPTAFVSSPSFPSDEFIHFHLEALTKPLITEYATKWLIAKRCNAKESIDIHRILSEKLDQPHLRDLARNPMQLAILLSLIHTRGSSLPDKRTALYDSLYGNIL